MPEINIKKSFRKSISMRFDRKGVLQVRAPVFMTKGQIHQFIEKNQSWIEEQKSKIQNSTLDPSKITEYKQLAKRTIPPRVQEFAEKYGFSYNTIKITSAQTRWGSCTSRKNLNFTYRLALAPQEVIDYVIVHELCHLRQMNHSSKFWSEVSAIMPDYKDQERWLKENGASIS